IFFIFLDARRREPRRIAERELKFQKFQRGVSLVSSRKARDFKNFKSFTNFRVFFPEGRPVKMFSFFVHIFLSKPVFCVAQESNQSWARRLREEKKKARAFF